MKKKNTLVKVIIIVGAIAAIFLAATVIYKRYNRKLRAAESDSLDFDTDDFEDDDYDDIIDATEENDDLAF